VKNSEGNEVKANLKETPSTDNFS